MRKNKSKLKKSSKWNIAATHYLTAGFAMPILVNIGVGVLFDNPSSFIIIFSWLLGIAAGVAYSASYIRKTYLIEDVATIAKICVGYNILIYLLFILNSALKPYSENILGALSEYFAATSVASWIILGLTSSALIYFLSSKFLDDNYVNSISGK